MRNRPLFKAKMAVTSPAGAREGSSKSWWCYTELDRALERQTDNNTLRAGSGRREAEMVGHTQYVGYLAMSAVLTWRGGIRMLAWLVPNRGGFCGGGLNDRQRGARHSRLAVPTRKRARRTGRKKENTRNVTLEFESKPNGNRGGGGVWDPSWFGPPCVRRDKSEGLFSRREVLCVAW